MHRISLFIVAAFSLFQNTRPQILKSQPLPDPYQYDDISVSSVIENWDENRQVYNYKIEAKNIGNNYFMYSYTHIDLIGNIINPVKKDNPFYTKTVISPNEEFDLEFESSDQITQNNLYIYSYRLDDFDNSIVYEECVQRIDNSRKMPNNLFGYSFFLKFNEVTYYTDIYENEFSLVAEITYENHNYSIFCDETAVVGTNTLECTFGFDKEVDVSKVDIENVKVIKHLWGSDLLSTPRAMGKFLIPMLIVMVLATPVPFIVISISKKRRRNRVNKKVD